MVINDLFNPIYEEKEKYSPKIYNIIGIS